MLIRSQALSAVAASLFSLRIATENFVRNSLSHRGVSRVLDLACGSGKHAIASKYAIGIDIPVYPVKGYSITLPIVRPELAPVSTLMDETYKVAITRLADRVRVAGTAELAGFDLSLGEERRRTVRHVAADLFGEAVDMDGDQFWTGLRPMTPDSVPVVGATPYGNLFLNTGHGTLGWTMSCGSSRLVADMVSGRQTEISSDGLQMSRYGFANRVRRARSQRPLRTAAAH